MRINIPSSLINKYLTTKELNEQVGEFYNAYFESFNDYVYQDNIDLYSYIKECLEVDEYDKEFVEFEKEYNLKNVKELNIKDYISNEYIKNINIENKIKHKGYTLEINKYYPYFMFIYDEINVDKNNYYIETYNIGYFKNTFKYLSLSKNNVTWMSTIPHEINTMKDDIKKVKGNVLVLGLGIGYFTYLINNKKDVKSITILENDQEIIEIFKKHILTKFKDTTKINIIKCDALTYLKTNDLSIYDYVYVDLYHDANDGIKFYSIIKNIEKEYDTKPIFLYWIETNILCLVRRIVLDIISDYLYSFKFKEIYSSLKENTFNSIVLIILNNIKDIEINSKEDLDYLLSDENLKKLIIK